MQLAWPIALLALASLAVPVAIHLLQRGQHRVVTVATTQFLVDNSRQRWRKLALEDPLLLLLRCLILLVAVLLLAEPFTTFSSTSAAAGSGWIAVSPRVAIDDARRLTSSEDSEWRWLTAGFPSVDELPDALPAENAWSLIAEADARLSAAESLTVVLPADADNFGVKRTTLRRPVRWQLAAGGKLDTLPPVIAAMVVYEPRRSRDASWLETVFRAWADAGVPLQLQLVPRENLIELADWTVWLSDDPLPQISSMPQPAPSRTVTVITDHPSAPPDTAVTRAVGARAHWQLSEWWDGRLRRLNIGSGLQADGPVAGAATFAELLLQTFAGEQLRQPPPGYPIGEAQIARDTDFGGSPAATVQRSLAPVLVLLLALLWCAERGLSAWTLARPGHGRV